MANLIHLNSHRPQSDRKTLIDLYESVILCRELLEDGAVDKVELLINRAELLRHKKEMGYSEDQAKKLCFRSSDSILEQQPVVLHRTKAEIALEHWRESSLMERIIRDVRELNNER